MYYNFQTVNRVVYGHGVATQIGEEVSRLGCKSVVLITDKGLIEHKIHEPLLQNLEQAGITAKLYADVELDPTPASIERAAAFVKSAQADLLIGLGGGSALDTAKATALLAIHEGPMNRYFGLHKVPSPCLPTIMIPTTAGTGSEMSSNSVLNDPITNSKQGTVSDYLYAKTVLLDPDLTLGLPPYYTAITGLDALVHAMESFVNVNSTPFTDALNIQSMRMLANNIRQAYANGGNREARAQMLYGAALSGMGFSNTQNGIIHAVGMAVPAQHHLPHGLLMAACAPMGMSFNAIAVPEKYALIAEILGSAPAQASTLEKAKSASQGFINLMQDLHITPGLKAHGITLEELPIIAKLAAATKRLMDGNPRKGTAKDLEALLNAFF
ncbi:MAG: iron-containing alcohol dehydrogenase [Desulfovibrionaceae bacterium]